MKQVILVITSAVFACLVGCGVPAYETPPAPPASQTQAENPPPESTKKKPSKEAQRIEAAIQAYFEWLVKREMPSSAPVGPPPNANIWIRKGAMLKFAGYGRWPVPGKYLTAEMINAAAGRRVR